MDVSTALVFLVSPYLPYMRQDARFQPGEVVTSRILAKLVSDTVDGSVTVDPHLHRYTTLGEIYSVPTRVGYQHDAGYAPAVCIGVHAVFADDAYDALRNAGAAEIISANSIPHPSNDIDLTTVLFDELQTLISTNAGRTGIEEKRL